MGPATASTAGFDSASVITAAAAMTGPIHMLRHEPTRSVRLLRSESSDGFHWSSCLWVIIIRQAVRTIASRLKNASYGRHTSVNAA